MDSNQLIDVVATDNATKNYTNASTSDRFWNYVVDMISFYIVFIFIGIVIAIIDDINGTSIDLESSSANLLLRLAGMILYGVYMGTIEAATGGRSLGKLFTKTKVVQLSNNPITAKEAFSRGFSRMVPFEVFSGFGGNPWHDTWTSTKVVKIEK